MALRWIECDAKNDSFIVIIRIYSGKKALHTILSIHNQSLLIINPLWWPLLVPEGSNIIELTSMLLSNAPLRAKTQSSTRLKSSVQ